MYGERIGINRIRLEFKAHNRDAWRTRQQVLIESDWNLKALCSHVPVFLGLSINRVRLEFKEKKFDQAAADLVTGINRIILEFKDYLII